MGSPTCSVVHGAAKASCGCKQTARTCFDDTSACVPHQDSIRCSAAWFLGTQQHAWGLAQQMAVHAAALPDHQQRLHVVYLANDLLLKACAAAPPATATSLLLLLPAGKVSSEHHSSCGAPLAAAVECGCLER
jgi:hypothetical protein